MKLIGLTGGIACGKSSVAAILKSLGVMVIDVDEITHQIYQPETPCYSKIIDEFGPHILETDGRINRQKLGEIIFNSTPDRLKLERITHPEIIHKMNDLIRLAGLENLELLVVEVPLLFEAGLEGQFDEIWVVSAGPDQQLERLMNRNNLTREEAVARLSAQLPLRDKEGKADVVIDNNHEFDNLVEKVKYILEARGYID